MTRWILTLQTQPCDVPESIRLRKLLKIALRVCGFRCVLISREGTESNAGERSGDGTTEGSSEGPECASVAQNASDDEMEVF